MESVQRIWDFLIERLGNPFGAAGIMGNLRAESALNPKNLQNSFEKKLGMTNDQYTQAVDDGSYANFAKDGAGYGLAQWTYWTRKKNLLAFAKARNASVGDLETQLEFLWKELGGYKSLIKLLQNAQTVQEASDAVLTQYEKPANQGESVKMARAQYAQAFYDQYVSPKEEEKVSDTSNKISVSALISLFQQALNEKWGYIWGKSGQVWTQANQNAATREQTVKYGAQWIGRRVADCSGLFAWAFKELGSSIYHGSNTIWREHLSAKGKIGPDTLLKPGTALFLTEGDNRHHIGLYVGNDTVIEAKGTRYGVTTSSVSHWDEWGELKKVDYSSVTAEERPAEAQLPTLRVNSSGEFVRDMQEKLLALGYPLGKNGADGKFGAKTKEAVLRFQEDQGLTVDGVCGPNTWAALNAAIAALPPSSTPGERETSRVTITGKSVNVRVGDSTKYTSVDHVTAGDTFEYVATSPTGWYAIRFGDRILWVSNQYAKMGVATP